MSNNPCINTPTSFLAASAPRFDAFLNIEEISQITSQGKSTIWARVKSGTFPSPIRISQGCTRWRASDIQKWMDDPIGWAEENSMGGKHYE